MTTERDLDVLAVGETMGLIRAERAGHLVSGMPLVMGFGGAESNALITAARLGASTMWVSRLGDDAVGEAIRRGLAAEGVSVKAERDAARRTGLMLKESLSPLRQRVTYYRAGSAASLWTSDLIADDTLKRTRLLLVSGITCAIAPDATDQLELLFRRARDAGVEVAFDLNYRSALWSPDRARESYHRLLPLADLAFAGVDEARVVSPAAHDIESSLAAIGEWAKSTVVVTDGANGAAVAREGSVVRAEAVHVPVVDTVGAGDAFVGAFIGEWVRDRDVDRCLNVAVAAGAHACMFAGDWEGAPTRQDLVALIDGVAVER